MVIELILLVLWEHAISFYSIWKKPVIASWNNFFVSVTNKFSVPGKSLIQFNFNFALIGMFEGLFSQIRSRELSKKSWNRCNLCREPLSILWPCDHVIIHETFIMLIDFCFQYTLLLRYLRLTFSLRTRFPLNSTAKTSYLLRLS